MSDTTSNQAALLKETYTKDVVNEILYERFALYKLLPKASDFKGLDQIRVPMIISMGGASASDFARAQINAKANSTGSKQFKVDRVTTNALSYLSDLEYRASLGSDAAFIEGSKLAVQACIYNLGSDLATALYGNGYGNRGQIKAASAVNSTTLTLSRVADSYNFDIGHRLQVNTNFGDAAKAYGSSGNPLIVTGVDRDAGTLTFGFNVNDATNGVPTIAASDYIYLDGDVATGSRTKVTGLDGWLPTSAPGGSDSFFGLNRSIDTQKLAGARIDGTQSSIIENINNATVKVAQIGGKPSHVVMSFDTWRDFINSQEGKTMISDRDRKTTEIGFTAATVATPTGPATVVVDMKCPSDRMYVLQMDTWKLHTLGDPVYAVGSDGGDGLSFRASYNSADWELRYSFTGGLVCSAPGWNAVVSL